MALLHEGSELVATVKETANCLSIKLDYRPFCRNNKLSIRPYLDFTLDGYAAATIQYFAEQGTLRQNQQPIDLICFSKKARGQGIKRITAHPIALTGL